MSAEEPSWERELFEVLDQFGARVEAEFADERQAELADRIRIEYRNVTLASRLMAEEGKPLALRIAGVGTLHGTLDRVATGWIEVTAPGSVWMIRTDALQGVRGVGTRAVAEAAWSVAAKLSIASPVRRLADEQAHCLFHHLDGHCSEGVPQRIGLDFIEIAEGSPAVLSLLPIASLAAIQTR